MVVIVLTAVPAGLRGHLTRWLLEIAPGVFCGRVSARVRDRIWGQILDGCKDGRALMVFTRPSDQGLDFRVLRHDWEPVDFDGISLMMRPDAGTVSAPTMRPGFSNASKRRRRR